MANFATSSGYFWVLPYKRLRHEYHELWYYFIMVHANDLLPILRGVVEDGKSFVVVIGDNGPDMDQKTTSTLSIGEDYGVIRNSQSLVASHTGRAWAVVKSQTYRSGLNFLSKQRLNIWTWKNKLPIKIWRFC